jgi:hypothetical protein
MEGRSPWIKLIKQNKTKSKPFSIYILAELLKTFVF